MRLRWHQLVEARDGFLDAAPFRYVNSVHVPVPPEQAWAALTSDDTLVSWSPLVTGVRWTSPRPFDVGATREVTILRFFTSRERYYRWEEGRRKTFTAIQVSLPGLRRLAEDYVVQRTPDGSSFTWTLAFEPHPALRPILRVANPIIAWVIRSVARGMRSRVW